MGKSSYTVLMVSTEYPPMQGGVGRYTNNLVNALCAEGIDVKVVSDSDGSGDYKGLSPFNKNNSVVLDQLVKKINPDIVHIQHEHGLYCFDIHPIFPNKTQTGIDKFYSMCKIPIVTTFHTSYNFKTWIRSIIMERNDQLKLKYTYELWKHLINYISFKRICKYAMSKSSAGIVLSNYIASLIPGAEVIYHGSEPFQSQEIEQKEARERLSLPENGKILLAQGFITATKGWDIISKMNIPDDWKLVINYSKNHYNKQTIDLNLNKNKNIINLNKNYLSEEYLSLLFFASDVVFLPYKVIAGSGTMFDGLAHGKPYLASNLEFFKEFSKLGLGIVTDINPHSFEKGLNIIDKNYDVIRANAREFGKKLKWDHIAKQHMKIYENIINIENKNTKLISSKIPKKF